MNEIFYLSDVLIQHCWCHG